MAFFNRKTSQNVIATSAEIDAAARALAQGDDSLANQLCDRAGDDHQRVAMAILGATVDHTPQNQ